MKTLKNTIMTTLIVLGFCLAQPARALIDSTTTWYALTNLPTVINGGATSNMFTAGTVPTNNVFSVRKDRGVSIFMQFAGTNAATTSTLTAKLALTPDGINYTTTGPIAMTGTANGATGVMEYTNIPPLVFNNAKKFTLQSLANGNASTNALFPTNVWFSFSNP